MLAKFQVREWLGDPKLWWPLALAYLIVCLAGIDDGGTNARARFATMRAMGDEHTFRIDTFRDWTEDWARTPDGHYYANKAPGPTLLGFPVFYVIDLVLRPIQEKSLDEQGRRQAPRGIHKVAVSTLLQVIPFLLLALGALRAAFPSGMSPPAFGVALLAILFGNTAAVLMNSYLGNPFAGMALLGVALFYLRGELGWASFYFGLTVLAEYHAAVLALPFAWLIFTEAKAEGWGSTLGGVCAGAAFPAALWCWYHTAAFGSPFSLPFQYEMQAVVGNVGESSTSLWGGFTSLLPNPRILFELLFGPSRGLLFTQPWILIVIPGGIFFFRSLESPRLRRLFLFSLAGFVLMLWLNSGFPGWHGGGSPGPRYLSTVLPIFGLFVPAIYQTFRWGLILTVGVSVIFRGLVFATWILPPAVSLWPYFILAVIEGKKWAELGLYAFVMIAAIVIYARLARAGSVTSRPSRPRAG